MPRLFNTSLGALPTPRSRGGMQCIPPVTETPLPLGKSNCRFPSKLYPRFGKEQHLISEQRASGLTLSSGACLEVQELTRLEPYSWFVWLLQLVAYVRWSIYTQFICLVFCPDLILLVINNSKGGLVLSDKALSDLDQTKLNFFC